MKSPASLTRDELVEIVSGLLQILYGLEKGDGSWTYAADKEWSGGDVCQDAAGLLDRFGLVPETDDDGEPMERAVPEDRLPRYALDIDGPQFRAQRALLLELMQCVQRGVPPTAGPDTEELVEGLIHLTDEIADQAHDNYGVDCLLDESD
jgi:hypothetical protein